MVLPMPPEEESEGEEEDDEEEEDELMEDEDETGLGGKGNKGRNVLQVPNQPFEGNPLEYLLSNANFVLATAQTHNTERDACRAVGFAKNDPTVVQYGFLGDSPLFDLTTGFTIAENVIREPMHFQDEGGVKKELGCFLYAKEKMGPQGGALFSDAELNRFLSKKSSWEGTGLPPTQWVRGIYRTGAVVQVGAADARHVLPRVVQFLIEFYSQAFKQVPAWSLFLHSLIVEKVS
uniref:Uncharacterized protein n=1 Tax=Chromera velia CCMP2878 TaxID=1169474 RepID=A0A0G4F8X7_9ALVE|eukprot:Cvel_15629.t1-p1 / transcript=Cvel_15629.t1 / gene=Cvel_15629 / organism=Chromera_velia_CCMP2878 / gene_product=hypothetical protein / transcript_product=hypothetical protein / location=Cvel_scaffold1164:33351-34740(+) / protein_length=233 / sequence_SO=supercontig / SO=protein_coding / is_pseudo=false